jgi:hypothetical protein
MVLKLI